MNIGVECVKEGCDNILTPEGIQLLAEIDDIIENDPDWPKLCLTTSNTDSSCANDAVSGKVAKISPVYIFNMVFGKDLSEITQYGIDFSLFGLAYEEQLFNQAVPLFSKDFSRENRKAKMTRFLVMNAGPIDFDGVRYKNMGDRHHS